ncbi:MAG: branched-chain amino acid ABC transporter permease, partial [Actinobacteria bacterium]|nr:branched-chain amino acid ABC transporter permease [Actinomycetota bacterium]NIU70141.1 branched-chain amino acid ABC transporter permease [Actinomycetota bacterium]
VTIELTNLGAGAAVVIATALVVNARHLMYSAALADHFRDFPGRWRYGLPYLMTDQAFAVAVNRFVTIDDAVYKRRFFLGAGLGLWIPWQITTATGTILGTQVPDSWSLDFAIPLVFMVLIIPSLAHRPGIVAAVVGGGTALLGREIPYRLGLIVAALAGIAAGVLAERAARR